ncbi:MAG TPA: FtsW/RodA/SpoVE family cell cycle protein [Blastocatellia bacterium]|nr:FtsW/RodA/SpoVE family cell cycle protein [Blastocatellia bacterium]
MFNRRFITDFDWVLLGMALLVCALGVIQISSVEPVPGMWRKQLVTILIAGLPILLVTTLFDYHKIVSAAPFFYAVGIALLIGVLLFGKEVHGNKSWLNLGPFSGQPSEIAKIFTIVMLTRYLAEIRRRPLTVRSIATACILWGVPAVLVYLEHDTGSTLSYLSFLAAMLILSGIGWRWIAAGAAALVLVIAMAGVWLSHLDSKLHSDNYKIQRILAVYFPEKAVDKYVYQNKQAEIAVGSGGVLGKGYRQGSQGTLGFLPEIQTDFIFAAWSEERGFLGTIFVLTLYALIITRLIGIARSARDRAGLLLAGGYAALLLCHVAVSVGMVVRLLPIIGIPLPLMSFGGSSLLATFFAFGLALNVRLRRFVN